MTTHEGPRHNEVAGALGGALDEIHEGFIELAGSVAEKYGFDVDLAEGGWNIDSMQAGGLTCRCTLSPPIASEPAT